MTLRFATVATQPDVPKLAIGKIISHKIILIIDTAHEGHDP